MPDKPDTSAAIAAALTPATDKPGEGTGAKPEATPAAPAATPASPGVGTDVKTEVPVKVSDDDITAFKARFGVDLSLLPDDESREKFRTEALETQKTIGKLQRENAELRKPPETPPAPAQPATSEDAPVEVSKLTDEQIAQALGINFAEADDRDNREIALTRKLLEQEERFERLERGVVASTTQNTWEKAFDILERDFGGLPEDTSRQDVYAWAAENGIASPEAAYWAAVGPVRASVAKAMESRLVELKTTAKKGATTLRPTGSVDVEEKLQSKTVKDGIKEAFEQARAKLGIELRSE